MTKVLLLGSDGMLGSALRRAMPKATALTRKDFDLATPVWNDRKFQDIVADHEYVVNAAGLINRRMDDLTALWAVNAVFPQALAALCLASGSQLIHISTDCVFDGKTGLHTEDDAPNATDPYGLSKALGENAAAMMVLRTSIIGPEDKNFYSLLCWVLAQEQPITGYEDHLWNGVTTIELARVISGIIEQKKFKTGIHNVHGEDISKADLIAMILDVFGKKTLLIRGKGPYPSDKRLRSVRDGFDIAPLRAQIETLARLADDKGKWR